MMLCQWLVNVEMPIQMITAKGSSDFNTLLRPESENICCNLCAGLKRSGFNARACPEKTNPPCATPAPTDKNQQVIRIGTIQRKTLIALQNKTGPPGVIGSLTAISNWVCKRPRHCRATSGSCQESRAMPPPQA